MSPGPEVTEDARLPGAREAIIIGHLGSVRHP